MDQWELPLTDWMPGSGPSSSQVHTAKQLGAYYTDSQIADFLVAWAVRRKTDTVADPSFGGGVFLRAAAKRVRDLGGIPFDSVFGVEIDESVHRTIGHNLRDEFDVDPAKLFRDDFFKLPPNSLGVRAIVGNPPFIRFHRFAGKARDLAIARSKQSGVSMTGLASSWAPFLVHAISMVEKGGRLAMVVPAEIGYAAYAAPLLAFLERSFAQVTILAFSQKLFPALSEDTYLLLADGKGRSASHICVREYESMGELARLWPIGTDAYVRADDITRHQTRLVAAFLPEVARDLYAELAKSASVVRLGAIADVGIGYVSGANSFFHLDEELVEQRQIPRDCLKKAVFKGRAVGGVFFEEQDWSNGLDIGDCGYLLHLEPGEQVPPTIAELIREGEEGGVSKGYKCRNRRPWYSVPNVYLPDAVLTYMSGRQPRFALNRASVYAPNTLHVVRGRSSDRRAVEKIALSWLSSLTLLSMEVEGHALGGGMLKLEPTEAENLLIGTAQGLDESLLRELDALVRGGDMDAASDLADEAVLIERIGLSRSDCQTLRRATDVLRARRGVK